MRTIEEYLEMTNYHTKDEVEHPQLTIEKMVNISPDLTPDNHLTYLLFLSLRPDLKEDEVIHYMKLSKIKRALEEREIDEQYKHFEVSSY